MREEIEKFTTVYHNGVKFGKIHNMKNIIAIIVAAGAITAMAAQVKTVKVQTLDGFGGDTSSVLSRCQTKEGKEYDPVVVTRDVTTLRDSKEFESISAGATQTDGGIEVTFVIKRKMRYVGPLQLEGNEEFGESKIAKEAELKDGYLYSEGDFSEAANKVKKAYQRAGYQSAKVDVRTKNVGGNNVNVLFKIEEGALQKICAYEFDQEILKKRNSLVDRINSDLELCRQTDRFYTAQKTLLDYMNCARRVTLVQKGDDIYTNTPLSTAASYR